jgi:hypothetical protein
MNKIKSGGYFNGIFGNLSNNIWCIKLEMRRFLENLENNALEASIFNKFCNVKKMVGYCVGVVRQSIMCINGKMGSFCQIEHHFLIVRPIQ